MSHFPFYYSALLFIILHFSTALGDLLHDTSFPSNSQETISRPGSAGLAYIPGSMVGARSRFEYRHSFKPPFLTKTDGQIPFWEFGGHAIPSEDSVRITPSLKNKRGWLWSRNQTNFPNWEVELSLRVTGRGKLGADGLALWFTENKGLEGTVFGLSDRWKGLAIFLDTYDNDGKHNNPAVVAMINDGTKEFNHDGDGEGQISGLCSRDFRNKVYPVKMRVIYYQRTLKILVTNGLSVDDYFEPCFEVPNVDLPKHVFIGLSAATGALADDHDVQYFLTHSLIDPNAKPAEDQLSDEEKKKFEKEFQEFVDKLKQTKEEYQKKLGIKPKEEEDEAEEESQTSREMRALLTSQVTLIKMVNELRNGLLLKPAGGAAAGAAPAGGPAGGAPVAGISQIPADYARRTDVTKVTSDLNLLLTQLKENVDKIAMRPGGDTNSVLSPTISKINEQIVHFTKEFGILSLLIREQKGAPQSALTQCATSCISPFWFAVIAAVQITVFIAYSMYKHHREMSAKKLF